MRDDTLVEPFAVPEFFVDGFSDHVITSSGVMTCAGYRLQKLPGSSEQQRVAVIRLVFPSCNLNEAIDDAKQAQMAPSAMHAGGRPKRH